MFSQASFVSATSLGSTTSAIARLRASIPCPVTADISKNGIAFSSASSRTADTRSGSCATSILLATTNIGFACQFLAEARELVQNHVKVVDRFATATLADIDQMNEQPGSLDVPQKLNTQSVPFMSTFN